MKNNVTLILILCCLLTACSRTSTLTPVGLQCEYLTDPVGIGEPSPHLTWRLSDAKHTRGQMQTACQIIVASSEELLTEDKADVWNSEKKDASPGSLPYGIFSPDFSTEYLMPVLPVVHSLHSSREYFWKVRVYDKDDKPSVWSEPARFVTGILDPSEWDEAAWIHHPEASRTQHVWFRKNFHLDNAPGGVFIHVASLGHHELYINGSKADDRVLAPALTNFDKRLFYVTYDISKLLSEGDNTVAVWFASGWANYDCFTITPALRVRLDGTDADRNRVTLNTDATWRSAISNSADTREVLTYNNNGAEIVDARRYIPDWNATGFDDSAWAFAATLPDQQVELVAHDIAPSRIIETLPAVQVTDAGDGVFKVDFGKNFTGWLNIKFRGLTAGDTVAIGSADDEETFADFNICNYFVSSGVDGETFSNRFNYIAGRYANLRGLPRAPRPEDLTAYAISTDLVPTGHFTSSNSLFNKIYDTDLWTFLANTTEGYTSDCPHRERCGYGEVATATSWGIGLPNYDAGAFYRNVVRNWRDVQLADGWGRNTAPQPNDYHWGGAIWSSAGLNVAWEHFMHYGDPKILRLIYPTAKRWLEFLHAHTVDGLLTKYREHSGQFLGDWLAPGSRNEFGDNPHAVFFNNCVYAMNLETFVAIAHLLEEYDDVELYQNRLDALRPAIHNHFYHPETALYSGGTQVQQAFAIITDIVPEEELERVEATIAGDMSGQHPYFDMGSSGLIPLLHYLADRPEMASITAKILNSIVFPSYGYFINQGETTWPEDWKIDVPSKIHTCYTGIAGWLTKGLCGIQPSAPGYWRFVVKPMIVDEVDFAEASVLSPYGLIESRWERKEDRLTLTVTVPPGLLAEIYIPASDPDRITESGKPLDKAAGITPSLIDGGYTAVEVESGRYYFECDLN
ncbi:MAG: glycoside hydrolase family 78 protein [Tannerellaceae bacterium]|nr:glycoside hydrolase family 78 protein [Tannerellaceae bacterium]